MYYLTMYHVQFMYKLSDVLFIAFSEAYTPLNKPFDMRQAAVFVFMDNGARTMDKRLICIAFDEGARKK